MTDEVNHPAHYMCGKLQPIDVIDDWNLDFYLGNVVKYICRAKHKGQELDDLKKAKDYIILAIARVEQNRIGGDHTDG